MPASKRLFVAIPMPASDALLHLLELLKQRLAHERINWVRPENLHLTLKFLGETPDFKIVSLTQALRAALSQVAAMFYVFDKTGVFGSQHSPRVLWLGMHERNAELEHLAELVIMAMHHEGFLRDRQNFVPHLTLGRLGQKSDKKRFWQIVDEIPRMTYLNGQVHEVVLYESILLPKGPRYVVLERFPLRSPS